MREANRGGQQKKGKEFILASRLMDSDRGSQIRPGSLQEVLNKAMEKIIKEKMKEFISKKYRINHE